MATQHDRQQAHLHGAGTLASASYGLWRYPDRARINPQDVTGGSTWHSVIQKIKVLFGGAPKPALARALPNGPKWSSSRQGAAPGAVQNGAAPGNEPQPASTWEVESPNKAPPAPRSFSRSPATFAPSRALRLLVLH